MATGADLVDTQTQTQTRIVTIDRSPPKRLLAADHWRTFKTGPDRQVWDRCMEPVADLINDGWRVTSIHVVWGKSYPGVLPARTIQRLCMADAQARYTWTWHPEHARGQTVLEMTL